MAQEIYHRSNWGSPTQTWGNSYLNADLTNELYKRASEYENSWVTDQLLNGVGTKPSIILTPTAYEDGVLNSVKPAKTFGSNLIDYDNLTYGSGGWSLVNDKWVFDDVTNGYLVIDNIDVEVGQKYQVTVNISISSGDANFRIVSGNGQTLLFNYKDFADGETTFETTVTGVDGTLQRLFAVTSLTDNSFTLNSISVKRITDASFDFTRGSSATRVNEKGLIEDVQILSGELVQNGDFEQIGSEQIINGGFDTDSDWIKGTGWTIANGKASFDGGSDSAIQQDGVSVSGKKYSVSIEVLDRTTGSLQLRFGSSASVDATITENGVYNYTLIADGTRVYLRSVSGFDGSIDNVSVKEVGQNWTFGTGWSIADGKVIADGTMTASDTLNQNYNFTDGNKYRFKFTVSDYQSGSVYIREPFDGLSDAVSSNGTFTFDYIVGTANEIRFRSNNGFTGSIDNVSVIEVTDDTDLPRINYTDGEGSLLLEPQSTNLITYSEDFSQWAFVGSASQTPNYSTSPSNLNDATMLNVTSAYIRFIITGKTSSSNQSIFVKRGGTNPATHIRLTSNNTSAWNTGSSLKYELTEDWTRINVQDGILTSSAYIIIGSVDETNTMDTDCYGTSLIWGAQVEDKSFATSYIPTNGSTVTRLADVCNNSGNSDLINSTEGVLYAEISGFKDDASNRYLSIHNGTNQNAVYIAIGGNDFLYVGVRSNNTTQYSRFYSRASGFICENSNKIAVHYKQNDFFVYLNGNKILEETSGSTPIGMDELAFNYGGSSNFYGNVKCVAVFKEALSDTELEKLTTI